MEIFTIMHTFCLELQFRRFEYDAKVISYLHISHFLIFLLPSPSFLFA
jgi:hypothetical protein